MEGRPPSGLPALLADLVFPGRCLGCGQWLFPGEGGPLPVCRDCLALLPSFQEPRCSRCGIELISEKDTCLRCRAVEHRFSSHRSLFPYTGMAKCLLQALKFEGRWRLAAFFACRAAEELHRRLDCGAPGVVVVPVPPRPGHREPDAVERVVSRLAAGGFVRVQRLLQRSARTPQKTLGYEQRKANLRGGIRVDPRASAAVPARVVLLDDVFTTGATADACAQALLEAGCALVDALTLVMEE